MVKTFTTGKQNKANNYRLKYFFNLPRENLYKNSMHTEIQIIFLTPRKFKHIFDVRALISFGIALFTRQKRQSIKTVKTHSALAYEYENQLYVRDTDKYGQEHYTLKEYTETFGDRMEIYKLTVETTQEKYDYFIESCRTTKIRYDFNNTFFWQVIKTITGHFFGKNTVYARMCAEDVQRQINLLDPIFPTPEETNPNELYLSLR